MSRRVCFGLFCLLVLAASIANAGEPIRVSHQGYLLDASDKPVTNGYHAVVYHLYADSLGGAPLWSESQDVLTSNGLFSTQLGRSVPLDLSLFDGSPRYLAIEVGGVELKPRLAVGSVPTAAISQRLHGDVSTAPGTLIVDTAGDGNGVVLNSRTRVNELEAKLIAVGLLQSARIAADSAGSEIELSSGSASGRANPGFPSAVAQERIKLRQGIKVEIGGKHINSLGDTTGSVAMEADEAGARTKYSSKSDVWSFGVSPDGAGSNYIDSTRDTLLEIGAGASGSFYRSSWQGSEVAIKAADSANCRLWAKYKGKMSGSNSNPLYEGRLTPTGYTVWEEETDDNGIVDNPLFEQSGDAHSVRLYEHTGVAGQNPFYESKLDARSLMLNDSVAGTQIIVGPDSIACKVKGDIGPVKWMAPEAINLRAAGGGGSGGQLRLSTSTDVAKVTVRGWDPKKKIEIVGSASTNQILMTDTLGDTAMKISDFGFSRLKALQVGTSSELATLTVGGDICATGTIGACSDERYKTDIHPLDNALEKVEQLRGVSFRWKADEYPQLQFSNQEQVGLIAQEVKNVFPDVVSQSANGYYAIDYGKLTPLLIEAVKELKRTNDEKDSQIAQLSKRLEVLEAAVSDQLKSTEGE